MVSAKFSISLSMSELRTNLLDKYRKYNNSLWKAACGEQDHGHEEDCRSIKGAACELSVLRNLQKL